MPCQIWTTLKGWSLRQIGQIVPKGSVIAYQCRFEQLVASVSPLIEEYEVSIFISGLKGALAIIVQLQHLTNLVHVMSLTWLYEYRGFYNEEEIVVKMFGIVTKKGVESIALVDKLLLLSSLMEWRWRNWEQKVYAIIVMDNIQFGTSARSSLS